MAKPFQELALLSVPDLLRADPDFAARYLLLAQAAAECLTEFRLCTDDLAARFRADPERFEILLGDLTSERLAFARVGFQRWLKNTDRWKRSGTIQKYKSSLVKQWERARERAV